MSYLLELHPIVVESPGYEGGEAKNQDRARWLEESGIACVCDGTTSSLFADEGADHVVRFMERHGHEWLSTSDPVHFRRLFDRLISELLKLRDEAADRPIKVAEDMPDSIRRVLEEDLREKRRFSHRTTLISARLEFDGCGQARIRYFKCGDSELLVFDSQGKLIHTTAELRQAVHDADRPAEEVDQLPVSEMPFQHRSNVTDVLPDKFVHTIPSVIEYECPPDSSVLLASDGFLDAFTRPSDVFEWLRENEPSLTCGERQGSILSALHERLSQRRGDDDISFVWIPLARRVNQQHSYQPKPVNVIEYPVGLE